MSVYLEQWDIHWWDFTVDWMGHGFNKNVSINNSFLQLRYINLLAQESYI
jgi:hypothetical protein